MPISEYLKNVREKVGHDLLLLPAVAAIIVDSSGYILFQRRADDGLWSLPAGSIDPDETPSEAIVREVLEETGLHVNATRVLGVFGGHGFTCKYPNGDIVQYTTVVFLCKVISGDLSALDGESTELRFFAPDQMPALQVSYPKELFDMAAEGVHFN